MVLMNGPDAMNPVRMQKEAFLFLVDGVLHEIDWNRADEFLRRPDPLPLVPFLRHRSPIRVGGPAEVSPTRSTPSARS